MPIIASYMVPHPPMIVPDIGRGSEQQIRKTVQAYETVAAQIAEIRPETIIITSPHALMYADYFHISPGKQASGDFGRFRAPEVCFRETYDTELVKKINSVNTDLPNSFAQPIHSLAYGISRKKRLGPS